MSLKYKPLNNTDCEEEVKDDVEELQTRLKSYAQFWAIPLILILLITNIATIIRLRSEKASSDSLPLDYGISNPTYPLSAIYRTAQLMHSALSQTRFDSNHDDVEPLLVEYRIQPRQPQ